jgi:hypothetical protein
MLDRKQFVHVLIAASYEGDPIPSRMLSDVVSDRVISLGEEMRQIMTYQMPYPVSPVACGLKDVWGSYDVADKEMFAEAHPDLATAIALMVGVEDERTGTQGLAQEDKHGIADARGTAGTSVEIESGSTAVKD